MEINEINELFEKFEKSNLTEMNLEYKSVKLQLKKEDPNSMKAQQIERVYMDAPSRENISVVNNLVSKQAKPEEENLKLVKSPLVGTFYRAPSPEAKPFVNVGQKVKKGDILGMIEAMKLMNEVESPVDGEIIEIVAKNDFLVQFDQILFKIKE